ncbi:hypothetical protein A9R05_42135 (plasmid) [Burkholderia sp. KK1]|uniref:hypothetical protein n=1 Tax=Burkholderia sp. M701 TaxID=326454 RepID=UPI000979A208|nr:hypothetical protein [Burkholderia sp. M701]AQH05624.1 hypothetical protein A9R05_42135 [Burkholderia sp. KK1]
MLPWILCLVLAIMLAVAGVACFSMWKRIRLMDQALADKDRGISSESAALRCQHDDCVGLVGRLSQLVAEMLARLSDEAERAVGHTRETKWLENLAIDVRFAAGGAVRLMDVHEIRQAGYDVPDGRACDVGDVLRLAIEIDRAARNVELPLQHTFRRCQIERPQISHWVVDVLAMAQRLQHGDAERARKMLTDAIDLWKVSDLPTVASIQEHDRDILMARD